MKTKFESNVATEMPKTRASQEPGLPWKVSPDDIERVASAEEEYKSVITGVPPLKTRALFLVMLLVAVFITTLYYIATIAMEGERSRAETMRKEQALSSLKADINRVSTEKTRLSDNVMQLERKVRDLNAQKELFAVVLESLTKRPEEAEQNRKDNTGAIRR